MGSTPSSPFLLVVRVKGAAKWAESEEAECPLFPARVCQVKSRGERGKGAAKERDQSEARVEGGWVEGGEGERRMGGVKRRGG
jgi:hypothetical protein